MCPRVQIRKERARNSAGTAVRESRVRGESCARGGLDGGVFAAELEVDRPGPQSCSGKQRFMPFINHCI